MPGVMSAIVLCTFVTAFPLVTFFKIRQVRKALGKSQARAARWQAFVGGDYRTEKFWFRHLLWLLQFWILCCHELLGPLPWRPWAVILPLSVYIALLFR